MKGGFILKMKMIERLLILISLLSASALACSIFGGIYTPADGHLNCELKKEWKPFTDSVIHTTRVTCFEFVGKQNGRDYLYGNITLKQTIDSTVTYRQNALHELALVMESGEFWQVQMEHILWASPSKDYPQPLSPYYQFQFKTALDSTHEEFPFFNIFTDLLDTTATGSISIAKNYFLPFLRVLSHNSHAWTGNNSLHGVSYPTGLPISPTVLSDSAADSAAWKGLLYLTGTEQSNPDLIAIATAKSIQKWSRTSAAFPAPFSYELNKLWLVTLDPYYGNAGNCLTGTALVPEGQKAILYFPDSLKNNPRSIAFKISASMNHVNVNNEPGIWKGDSIGFMYFPFSKSVLDSVAALPTIPVAKAPYSKQNPITKWPEYTLGIHSKAPQNADLSDKQHLWYDLIGRRLP